MPGQWITIYTFNLPTEAYVIKGRLESEGIPCNLKDEHTIQAYNFYSIALNGVKLQVQEEDAADAIAIMKEVGYQFPEDEQPSRIWLWLKNITEKIPGIRRVDFLWRLIIITVLVITIFVLTVYFIQRKSTVDYLTANNWNIKSIMIYDSVLSVPMPVHVERHYPGGNISYDLSEMRPAIDLGAFSFEDNEILKLWMWSSKPFTARWQIVNDSLLITDCNGNLKFLNGRYFIYVDETLMNLQNDSLKINCLPAIWTFITP